MESVFLSPLPLHLPPDGGQFYQETNLNQWLVEPWNAISSLSFLVPAAYWTWKIRKSIIQHPFFFFCQVMLAIGGLGSALYHAFRVSAFLMLLDVLPITALTIGLGCNFWIKALKNLALAIWINIIFFFVRSYFFFWIGDHQGLNIAYFLTGTNITLPLIYILWKTNGEGILSLMLSLFFCGIALYFRWLDDFHQQMLPMGTHWLWHIFCGVGVFFLSQYLFKTSVEKRFQII